MRYDIAVIGNDEAAFEMLCLAAGSGKRTLAILPEARHSAWLFGQALRRLVSNLLVDRTAQRKRMFARAGTPRLIQALVARAVAKETADHCRMLQEIGVDVLIGEPRFVAPHDLCVSVGASRSESSVTADTIVIGTGVRRTAMHRPLGLIPFHRPESLFRSQVLPKSVCIIGGGHFGAGLASLTSLFGVETRHVARNDNSSVMLELATAAGVNVGHHPSDVGLPSFSELQADVVDCRRSAGFTKHLSLNVINVEPDENGRLWCASSFETWCAGVFGVGDVVGFSPDTALHPSVQAERVLNRIRRDVPADSGVRRRVDESMSHRRVRRTARAKTAN